MANKLGTTETGASLRAKFNLNDDRVTVLENASPGSEAVSSVAGKTGAVTLIPADVQLDQVNNTSDANKPVSTAQATAIGAKSDQTYADAINQSAQNAINSANTANNALPLKADLVSGKVPASQLPSYVDDVLEVANYAALPATGETGKIYITDDTNLQYRWSGSAYVQLVPSPGSTDAVPEGATNKYFTAARVLATVLVGYAVGTGNVAVTAADSIIASIQKLSGSILDIYTQITNLKGGNTTDTIASLRTGINAATTTFQAETLAYQANFNAAVLSAGIPDRLTSSDLNAIDTCIVTLKNAGVLAKCVQLWAPFGQTLAGALVNLYAGTGIPTSMINNNFLVTDYSRKLGFGTSSTANTTKYLDCGYTPLSKGLTKTNICFGAYVPEATAPSFAYLMGLNPSSGSTPMYIKNGGITVGFDGAAATSVSGYNIGFAPCTISSSFGGGTGLYNNILNGATAHNSTNTVLPAGDLDSNITLFKSGTTYSGGRISSFWVANYLTPAENKILTDAMFQLAVDMGTYNTSGGRVFCEGDSITLGAGATATITSQAGLYRWASIFATNVGLREFNTGVGSSQLRQTVSATIGITSIYARFSETLPVFGNAVTCMAGTNDLNNADTTSTGDSTLIADYKTKLTTMVLAWKAKGLKVMLLCPPYNAIAATPIARRNAWQLACFQVADTNGVLFVDTETLFTDLANPSALFADQLHPNTVGHGMIGALATSVFNGKTYRNILSVDFPSIPANSSVDYATTFYMPGAKANMAVSVGLPNAPVAGLDFRGFVSADNYVTVRAYNLTTAAIDPAAMAIKITLQLF